MWTETGTCVWRDTIFTRIGEKLDGLHVSRKFYFEFHSEETSDRVRKSVSLREWNESEVSGNTYLDSAVNEWRNRIVVKVQTLSNSREAPFSCIEKGREIRRT